MNILTQIIPSLPAGEIERIAVGSHWIASVVRREGEYACGLSSTPVKGFAVDGETESLLESFAGQDANELLPSLLDGADLLQRGIGLATLNALLTKDRYENWAKRNAGEVSTSLWWGISPLCLKCESRLGA